MSRVPFSRLRTWLFLAAAAVATAGAPSAEAQDAAALAKARERFREAAALQAAGDWGRALDAYKEVALVKSSATLRFNIATCEEKTGDYLRAMGSYRFALTEATKSNAKDMESAVKKALEALEPRIPTLLLKRGEGAATAEVSLDGRALGNPSVGTAFQVNPGPHEIRATAPDREALVLPVTLEDREKRVVELVLKPAVVAGPITPAVVPEPSVPEAPPADAPPPTGNRPLRIAGFAVGGLGVAGLVSSAVLFSLRQSTISDLNAVCGASRMGCPASATPKYNSLVTYNTGSIGALVAGGAALAVGAVLVIVSTRKPAPAPAVGLALLPGGGSIAGTF